MALYITNMQSLNSWGNSQEPLKLICTDHVFWIQAKHWTLLFWFMWCLLGCTTQQECSSVYSTHQDCCMHLKIPCSLFDKTGPSGLAHGNTQVQHKSDIISAMIIATVDKNFFCFIYSSWFWHTRDLEIRSRSSNLVWIARPQARL